jgi:hypothetical protein
MIHGALFVQKLQNLKNPVVLIAAASLNIYRVLAVLLFLVFVLTPTSIFESPSTAYFTGVSIPLLASSFALYIHTNTSEYEKKYLLIRNNFLVQERLKIDPILTEISSNIRADANLRAAYKKSESLLPLIQFMDNYLRNTNVNACSFWSLVYFIFPSLMFIFSGIFSINQYYSILSVIAYLSFITAVYYWLKALSAYIYLSKVKSSAL